MKIGEKELNDSGGNGKDEADNYGAVNKFLGIKPFDDTLGCGG